VAPSFASLVISLLTPHPRAQALCGAVNASVALETLAVFCAVLPVGDLLKNCAKELQLRRAALEVRRYPHPRRMPLALLKLNHGSMEINGGSQSGTRKDSRRPRPHTSSLSHIQHAPVMCRAM
jgi:hypothetical protein